VAYLRFFACLSQKGTCAVSSMAHRGQRSIESLEFRKARQFCFGHSKFDSKLQERTFIGIPEAVRAFIEAAVEKISFNVKALTEAWSKMSDMEDPLRLAEGQKKLGDYVR
jgi:hypothetical protein